MLYDLDRSAFVGDAGMLPSRPDDEISRKLAMLIEGECTRLGPPKAGLMKWPEFGRFGGNLVLQNCRAPSHEFRLCVSGDSHEKHTCEGARPWQYHGRKKPSNSSPL